MTSRELHLLIAITAVGFAAPVVILLLGHLQWKRRQKGRGGLIR